MPIDVPPARSDTSRPRKAGPPSRSAVRFPYAPMEARTEVALPTGNEWQYEPKWDGFRCLVFRDGDEIRLQSKAGRPLDRYFPDVVDHIRKLPGARFVLDGELIVPVKNLLSFDDLLQRIHPAASRVARLAHETPAFLVVFDLLAENGKPLVGLPLAGRRARLERFMARHAEAGLVLSPATRDRREAEGWLEGAGGGLDGVVAKRLDLAYASGARTAMVKIKRRRTADCVVGGFRYGSGANANAVGSLLLGLYDAKGALHHVGFTSGIRAADRAAVTRKLEGLEGGRGFTGRAPGGPSRWSTERSTAWRPVRPTLTVEVEYDHFNQGRFRHGTKFLRWRPDKAARQCTFEQVRRRVTSTAAWLESANDRSYTTSMKKRR